MLRWHLELPPITLSGPSELRSVIITVVRFAGWTLLALLLLVVLVVTLAVWAPQLTLDIVNRVQSAAVVKAPTLELDLLPPRLTAEQMHVESPGMTLELASLNAGLEPGAWWRDEPFWFAASERVLVTTRATDTPESEAESETVAAPAEPGESAPLDLRQLASFQHLAFPEVVVTDTLVLQVLADSVERGFSITLAGVVAGNELFVQGHMGDVEADRADLHLEGSWGGQSGPDSIGAEFDVRGALEVGEALALALEPSRVALEGVAADPVAVDIAGGRVGYDPASDRLTVDTLIGALAIGGAAHDLQLDADLAEVSTAPGGTAELVLAESRVVLEGRYDLENAAAAAQVALTSTGAPDFVSIAPLQPAELFPLAADVALTLAPGRFEITRATLETPTSQLSGEARLEQTERVLLHVTVAAEDLYIPLPRGATEEDAVADSDSTTVDEPAQATAAAGDTDEPAPLFGETPLDWTWLERADVQLDLQARTLKLGTAALADFVLQSEVGDGVLALRDWRAGDASHGFRSSGDLRLQSDGSVESRFDFAASGLRMEEFGLLPAESLSGGDLQVDIGLATRGQSAAELAGGLAGSIRLSMEDARLANDLADMVGSDMLLETLNKLNPFRQEDPATEISCALVQFDVADGTLVSNNQLVVETSKMEIVGDGRLDLVSEDLDITFSPTAKAGVGLNVGSLVKFVKLGGTLREPVPEVDAMGLVASGAAVGAALSTGGISVLAEGLAKRALTAGSACDPEAGAAAAEAETGSAPETASEG